MSSLQEVILEADLRCTKCQERITNAVSRADDVESMEVHVLKKKVILTCKSETHLTATMSEETSSRKVAAVAVDNKQPPKVSRITTAWFPFPCLIPQLC